MTSAASVAVAPGGKRALGFLPAAPPSWLDYELDVRGSFEFDRRIPMNLAGNVIGPAAIDAAGRLLALGVDSRVSLFWATTLLPVPNGTLDAGVGGPIEGLT